MTALARRSLVRALLAGGAIALAGCSRATDTSTPETTEPTKDTPSRRTSGSPRVLLAYFSRPGENYYYGGRTDLEVGNTEVLAGLIADRLDCDVHRIEAADPYPADYDSTVQRNVEEQDADARPGIAGELPDLGQYDVVVIGSPIWNVRPPMIMQTFTEALDFAGKTVLPVVTHAVSGLGRAERDYREACPGATLGEALAVQGEKVADAGADVDAWIARVGLPTRTGT